MNKTLVAILLSLGASSFADEAVKPPAAAGIDPTTKIYQTKCVTCHGKDFKGSAGMAKMLNVDLAKLDLTQHVPKAKTDELIKIVTDGKDKMTAFKDKLKPQEISSIVAYIQSQVSASTAPAPSAPAPSAPVPSDHK
jgi:mono/diheme cytochrome c family protein